MSETKIELSVDDILKTALRIFTQAAAEGIPTPNHVSQEFKELLYNSYRDTIDSFLLDPNTLGHLLGNRSRWTLPLCKFFTLNFLEYFAQALPQVDRNKLAPTQLTIPKNIELTYYKPLNISVNLARYTATLFLAESRTLSIKANILYPNVAKAKAARHRDEYSYKWVNLRYKMSENGNVSIIKLPRIRARLTASGKFSTEGILRNDIGGEIIKYSYCTLAQSLKTLCALCLELLVDNRKEYITDSSFAPMVKFVNLLNLIYKRNYKFYITSPYVPAGDLFSLNTRVFDPFEYRINGDSNVFVVFGSLEKLQALLRIGLIEEAFESESFNRNLVNIEDFVEDDEPIYALLFEALSPPDKQDNGFSVWSMGTEIGERELLDEFQINQVFNLGV